MNVRRFEFYGVCQRPRQRFGSDRFVPGPPAEHRKLRMSVLPPGDQGSLYSDDQTPDMGEAASNRFGGAWTEDKLAVLREYLKFYTVALKDRFDLIYIDTFAGTGRCQVRVSAKEERVIDGSATIALDTDPPFERLHFIERRKIFARELRHLIEKHPNGARASLVVGDAAGALSGVLDEYKGKWGSTRGVLFLDPYGLQCTWAMLCEIAETKALDVFFLVSLSGLFRQAAVDEKGIDEGKAKRLTTFLGTDEWRRALYKNVQSDLWGAPQVTREPGYQDILLFVTDRMKERFPHVGEPLLLRAPKKAPLYALFFAVSNPSSKARELAARVGKTILSKLR